MLHTSPMPCRCCSVYVRQGATGHAGNAEASLCHLRQYLCWLQGTEAAPLVQDWVKATQSRAVAEQTSALLQAHAATLAASLSQSWCVSQLARIICLYGTQIGLWITARAELAMQHSGDPAVRSVTPTSVWVKTQCALGMFNNNSLIAPSATTDQQGLIGVNTNCDSGWTLLYTYRHHHLRCIMGHLIWMECIVTPSEPLAVHINWMQLTVHVTVSLWCIPTAPS